MELPPSPISPLLVQPSSTNDPFENLTDMTLQEVGVFVAKILRSLADTPTFKATKSLVDTVTTDGINRVMVDYILDLAKSKNITFDQDFMTLLMRASLTVTRQTSSLKDMSRVSYTIPINEDKIKVNADQLMSSFFIIYYSADLPAEYFPLSVFRNKNFNDNPTLSGISYKLTQNNIEHRYILLGTELEDNTRYVGLSLIPKFAFAFFPTDRPYANYPRYKRRSSTVGGKKGDAARQLKQYIDVANSIDLSGYQWSMSNILGALRGGFPDAIVSLSDQSKTYNVDRTIVGMFSAYFNTAFKTNIGTTIKINVSYKDEFEQYLAYLSGQSNSMLDTSQFLNHFAFAQLIGDDYLSLTIIRQLGIDLASLSVTLADLTGINDIVGSYISNVKL